MNSTSTEPASSGASRRELRQFGLTMAVAIGLVFGLLIPWIWDRPWPRMPWLIAGAFAGTGLLIPVVLAPLFRAWMRLAHVLGIVNTKIILTLAWALVLVPTGLAMRVFATDPMRRQWRSEDASYRQESTRRDRDHFLRPF